MMKREDMLEPLIFGKRVKCGEVLPGDFVFDVCSDGCCTLLWFILWKEQADADRYDFIVIDQDGEVTRTWLHEDAWLDKLS